MVHSKGISRRAALLSHAHRFSRSAPVQRSAPAAPAAATTSAARKPAPAVQQTPAAPVPLTHEVCIANLRVSRICEPHILGVVCETRWLAGYSCEPGAAVGCPSTSRPGCLLGQLLWPCHGMTKCVTHMPSHDDLDQRPPW